MPPESGMDHTIGSPLSYTPTVSKFVAPKLTASVMSRSKSSRNGHGMRPMPRWPQL